MASIGIAEFAGLELQDWKLTDWKLMNWNLKDWKGLQIDRLDNREVLIISFSIKSILSHERTNV